MIDPKEASSGLGRVVQGGSWYNFAGGRRSAGRSRNATDDRNNVGLGFRLVHPVE